LTKAFNALGLHPAQCAAVAMVLQANCDLAEESLRGADVVREPLALTTA
jgi:hypothetical protein